MLHVAGCGIENSSGCCSSAAYFHFISTVRTFPLGQQLQIHLSALFYELRHSGFTLTPSRFVQKHAERRSETMYGIFQT
jgi:hypothetical protein